MLKIAIIGSGYVGLITGTCLAELGNKVICADNDKSKIKTLNSGRVPIYEPSLGGLIARNARKGRLLFTSDVEEAIRRSEVIFICVGTPPRKNGSADLGAIERVSRSIAKNLSSYKLIVEKSTVPVETGGWVKKTIRSHARSGASFDVASNPEFLREGSAIKDFMRPDRMVFGVESKKAENLLRKLYRPIKTRIIVTSIEGAEIIKHAANSFLAAKISFINALSNICERTGADVNEVALGIGLDKRINTHFLKAGIGFGGFCFPKDVRAFIHIAAKLGYPFTYLKEVERVNDGQKKLAAKKITSLVGGSLKGKTIGVWGLSFKPDTDDVRCSPSIDIIRKLLGKGANVRVYDPAAMGKAKNDLKNKVLYCGDEYSAVKGADCAALMTEWKIFEKVDWKKVKRLMKNPACFDGRNLYDPVKLRRLGFRYEGIGRG